MEKARREKLIYGCNDIEARLQELELLDLIEGRGELIEKPKKVENTKQKKKSKNCSEYFLLNPEKRFLTIFDGYMAVTNFYACVTSVYFTCFDAPF